MDYDRNYTQRQGIFVHHYPRPSFHPLTILAAFKGYPIPAEHLSELLNLVTYIVDGKPANISVSEINKKPAHYHESFQAKLSIAVEVLKKQFPDLYNYSTTLKDITYIRNKTEWVNTVELCYGKALIVIRNPYDRTQTDQSTLSCDSPKKIIDADQQKETYIMSRAVFTRLFVLGRRQEAPIKNKDKEHIEHPCDNFLRQHPAKL